jgi:proline racemase
MHRYKTIDAHVAGEAVRLLIEGAPSVKGKTMRDKLAWIRAHGEPLRRALMLEPRGHAGMHGALFTEPVSPTAHAGLLFMNAAGYPLVSGEGVMAAATIALEQKIIQTTSDELNIDTAVGLLTVRPRRSSTSTTTNSNDIALTGLSGFVHAAGLVIQLGGRAVPVDVAFGGELYAIADGEAVGIPIDADHASELIRAASRVQHQIDAELRATHPTLSATDGVIFTAPARQDGHLRSASVLAGGVLRRSPGVTGTVALMAVLDAIDILEGIDRFVNEGVLGTTLAGTVLRRQTVDDIPSIVAQIDGTVVVTGHHEFVVEPDFLNFRM